MTVYQLVAHGPLHMAPYFDDKQITLFCADWRTAGIETSSVDLAYADPPYGVSERTARKSNGRGKLAECNDFPPVFGDSEPFDPAPLLRFKRVLMWGANHFAERLPSSPAWLAWDKREAITSNDNADCELAWTNWGGPARLFHHRWNGMIKASEQTESRIHPTQKPVALAHWALTLSGIKPKQTVLIPYAGSGSEIVAARNLGLRVIAFEIAEPYCERIVERLSQPLLPFAPTAPREMEQVSMFEAK